MTLEKRSASGFARFLPGDVGRRAVHRLEDRRLRPQVRARDEPEPADEPRAEVGHDVAVEVLEQQHVELLRPEHELHAGVVDDELAVR
jgi:hypothetical protein